jgi:hypothetical protein
MTANDVIASDPQQRTYGTIMSLLDAHIPQLVAAQSAFGTKAALMRHTIGQAEQEALSAQATADHADRRFGLAVRR